MKFRSRFSISMMASIMLSLVVIYSSSTASTTLKPLNGKSVTLRVSNKDRMYHLVTPAEPIRLQVSGPVKIQVITRLAMPSDASDKMKYAIQVNENGKAVKTYSTSTGLSKAAFSGIEATPGKRRKFSLAVPEGEHTFTFSIQSEHASSAALRFMLSGKRNLEQALHGKSVRLEPLSSDRIATAVVAEKLITYYVASRQKEVQLRVIGPTRIVVNARLNFESAMLGKQKYTLSVVEGAKTIAGSSFSTTKSVDAYYKDWKQVVPGKINYFNLDVPAGEHIYRFSLGDGQARSVSLKFSIPEKDVKNEK